jgi:hypothetical protein
MKITISDALAFKTKDGWLLKYTLIHDMLHMDPWYNGQLFDLANKQIEEFLQIKITEEFIKSDRYTSFRYIPKSPEEEAFFVMKFPTIENMEIEI